MFEISALKQTRRKFLRVLLGLLDDAAQFFDQNDVGPVLPGVRSVVRA